MENQQGNSMTQLPDQIRMAEVAGVVTSVNFPQHRGDPTNFRINCPNMHKIFDAVCNLFCPIRQGDTIYALCMVGQDGKLYVTRPPFVQPAIDRDSVIQCFMRALKQGYYPVNKIYSTISRIAGGDEAVIPFLTGIAQSWNDTHNAEILFMFDGIEPDDIKKLLSWWHRERNLRRLYLFGLTKKEINACRMTCDDIYQKCVVNPYTVPAIPMDKCDGIMDRLNKRPGNAERTRGAIIRVLWKNLHESGWSGTPTRFLSRQFPGIKEHVESLKEEYGMIAEMETAYLKFPHKVETYVSEYLTNKRINDLVQYDTPVDEVVTLPNGKMVQRSSAHFTRDLSEDQQRAIQGALDHSICIITGGGGVGKCNRLGTKVLMFDGQIKVVEDLEVGDLLMGPDSKPRTVLSKCFGTDNMFEIKPNIGRSFVCNTPHVLTLISSELPPNKYNLATIDNGLYMSKIYDTVSESYSAVQVYKYIFDVPLDEYLNWPESVRDNCRVFHAPIDFPYRETSEDPICYGADIGLYLSRGISSSNNQGVANMYKINTKEIRTKFLLGLMEYAVPITQEISQFKCLGIPNAKQLLDDIEYIALSIGYLCVRRSYNCIEEIDVHGWNQLIFKHLPISSIYDDPLKTDALLKPFTVNSVGVGEYCGFELTGDGRYLLGDFLVTHNTTCIGQIVHNLELRGVSYAICSFTGKAVARIREVTKKRNPATMHRLISNTRKNQLDKRSTQFEKDIPLMEYDHVIIDEVSMVTTELLYDFVEAYPNIQRLTLVGDVNQLPPIGWGSLFHQMLKSETIPTYKLTTNYRVYTADGERDGVILNANAIVTHDPVYPFEFVQTTNFSIIEGPIERVYDIIRGCFSSGVRADQIVVISPFNRYLDTLNRNFQDIYNRGARNVTDSRGVRWMIGDRVMLTENDQEIGVFNGESGTIRDITHTAILVDFGDSGCHEFLLEPTHDGRYNYQQGATNQYYRRGRLMDDIMDGDEGDIDDERTVKRLIHAYALTVDKSQGSEWDFVIFFVPEFNTGSFLNKNRIYTAITRCKRACWCVVSDSDSFNIAAVKPPPFRCENLSRRLISKLPNLKPFTILRPQITDMLNDLPIIPDDIIPSDAYDMGFDCDDFD